MSDHEHDEGCEEGEVVYVIPPQPNWRFSTAEVVGITLYGLAGALNAFSQMVNMIGREFVAAGNHGRDKKAWRLQQRAAREEEANIRRMYEAADALKDDDS